MGDLPRKDLELLTISVVDWEGPIVEIVFRRPITTAEEADRVASEARLFMDAHVVPKHAKAYFLTGYDNFAVSREHARRLQESFIAFNRDFSLGDVRYGGSLVAKALVISTSIKAESASELHATREEALQRLRERIRGRS